MNPKPKVTEEFSQVPGMSGYETILRSLQVGVCRLNRAGTIVYVNDTVAEMLGRKKEDLVGSSYPEAFFGPEVGRQDPRCGPFEFALAEGEMSHINTETLIRKDGSELLSELICVPVNDGAGGDGAVVSLVDVTDRRQVEEAVSDARDKALAAARSKADFLANMSHEIRTPLTGIIGTVDLMSATDLNEDQRGILSIQRTSTELLLGIVNEILDFSKIEAGKFVIRNEVFSLRSLTEAAVEPFRPLASGKKIDLTIEYGRGLPDFVECDSRCVQQVLNNLLSNALKFTREGSIGVELRMGNASDRLRFIVSDSGIGIPDSEKEMLFAPFEQADTSGTRYFEGTGLGLAISRRLINLMGGELGFESEKGVGTEFWFEIPFNPASEGEAPVRQKVSITSEEQKTEVLVVEDNPVNLEVATRLLKQIGVEAESAASGEEAIALCGEKDFDIVLMDCQMPGMDGYEAARRIKEKAGTVSIFAFTASVNENDLEKIAASGMSGILRKPFTQNDLTDIINTSRKGNETLDLKGYFVEYAISKFIEPDTLEQLGALDTNPRGFLREIFGVFGGHFSEKLPVLISGISKLDRAAIESTAHNLKGSSANLGLTKLSGLLQALEDMAPRADGDELEEILHDITVEFGMIREAITELEEGENLK